MLVRIAGTSDAGSYEYEQSVVEIGPWETASVPFTIPSAGLGNHGVVVSVDPDDTISELEEDDNSFSHSFYASPALPGFPVQLGLEIHSPCVSHVGSEGKRVLVPDEDGRIWALDPGGAIEWASNPSWGPSYYGREIAAASGDLDGGEPDQPEHEGEAEVRRSHATPSARRRKWAALARTPSAPVVPISRQIVPGNFAR
mgnify:CR=1 FL=1